MVGSKTNQVLELLKWPDGVTAKELMKTTGWQAHSVRGFLSGTVGKKMGLTVTSSKSEDGERSYPIKPAWQPTRGRRGSSAAFVVFQYRSSSRRVRAVVLARRRCSRLGELALNSGRMSTFPTTLCPFQRSSSPPPPPPPPLSKRPCHRLRALLPSRSMLPALNHDIHVLWIKLDAVTDTFRDFRRGERRSAAKEWVVYQFAAPEMIQNRAAHQFDGLLRRVIELLLVGTTHDELGRRRCPNRRVLAGFTEPGSVLFCGHTSMARAGTSNASVKYLRCLYSK